MRLRLDLQVALDPAQHVLPTKRVMSRWIKTALADSGDFAELTVRVVSAAEMADLNGTYRHKAGPTNVLSFESGLSMEEGGGYLGDIVLCPEVVEREASEQNKALEAHWAHMLVHGTLHLLGYDHIDESEAQQMEKLEVDIMKTLKFSDPYQAHFLL